MHSSSVAGLAAPVRRLAFGSTRAFRRVGLASLSLFATTYLVTACTHPPWSELKDAGVSADGKAIYILIERGHTTRVSGSIMGGGDWERYDVETLEIHRFVRASAKLTRVHTRTTDVRFEREAPLTLRDVDPSIAQTTLASCGAHDDEQCLLANIPRPYRVGDRIVDPVIAMSVALTGARLEATPVAPSTVNQILRLRYELMRRFARALYKAADADLAARLKRGVEPDRVESSSVPFPSLIGASAEYRIVTGARIEAQLSEAPLSWRDPVRFRVVWHPDGSCQTDHRGMAVWLPCYLVPTIAPTVR